MKKISKIVTCSALLFFVPVAWAEDSNRGMQSSEDVTSYVACGCGCCGTEKPRQAKKCLKKEKGESLSKIMDDDSLYKKKNAELCAVSGCSLGTEYHYCD